MTAHESFGLHVLGLTQATGGHLVRLFMDCPQDQDDIEAMCEQLLAYPPPPWRASIEVLQLLHVDPDDCDGRYVLQISAHVTAARTVAEAATMVGSSIREALLVQDAGIFEVHVTRLDR